MNDPVKIAVAGLGTVGAGLIDLLDRNADLVGARAGRPIRVTSVAARDRGRDRGIDIGRFTWFDDAASMAAEADCDIVVELIGGEAGPAKATVETALDHGRHVVTANKALLAHHGGALAALAARRGLALAFEAAVAGGIPVVKALREGLSGNRIAGIRGILNGTCNYILTEMAEAGSSFDAVLAEAQRLGYAEADPAFDVDGIDAAHKLALLAAMAFGGSIDFDAVSVEGVRGIAAADIAHAEELGFTVKLLGVAAQREQGVACYVYPCLLPKEAALAGVGGVLNAVTLDGDQVGQLTLIGPGAGAGPTASAVAADLVDLAAGRRTPFFGQGAESMAPLTVLPIARRVGAYYLRLEVIDRPGVIARITGILADHGVSVEDMLQRHAKADQPVSVVLTTHDTSERAMRTALDQIKALEAVAAEPIMLRIERG